MDDLRTSRSLGVAATDLVAIGRRLVAARLVAGMKAVDVAGIARVGANAVSQWENGTRRPAVDQVVALLPLFRVTLDWIYLGDDRGLDWQQREAIVAKLKDMATDTPVDASTKASHQRGTAISS